MTAISQQRTAQQNAISGSLLPPEDRLTLREQFLRPALLNLNIGVAANLDFELLGVNAANANSVVADGGGNKLTTAGADGDGMILLPHLDTKQTAWSTVKWNTNDEIGFSTLITTGASVTNTIIWAGLKLTNTNVVATDNNQAFFRYEDDVASGKLQFISSNAGTDETTTTAQSIAASTSYRLEIKVDADRVPSFYCNGELLGQGAALASDVDLIPYVAVEADGAAAAKVLTVREIEISKVRND